MDSRHGLPCGVDEIAALLAGEDLQAIDRALDPIHPADLADLFLHVAPGLRPRLVSRLDIPRTSFLMKELPRHLRDELASLLGQLELVRVVEELPSDDTADVLADLSAPAVQSVIGSLLREDRQEVVKLLGYPPDSAGGLMQTELIAVTESQTVDQAGEALRTLADRAGHIRFVYVVDGEGRLAGVVTLEKLILAPRGQPVRDLMKRDIHGVTTDLDQEQVARMFRRYDLVALPVVDEGGVLVGRILHDDVVDVLEEEAQEDILHMAGVGAAGQELVYSDRRLSIAAARIPWLLATLAGLNVSALLYWRFQLSFPGTLALIPFIPVVSAMGGNMGTQTSTIVVRGFATGRVDLHNLGRVIRREILVSVLIGVVCGLIAGAGAAAWHGNPRLGLTVAVAMTAAIMAAAAMGVLVPYFFRVVRIDPAIAAGPLVTTLEDVLGVSIYYACALLIIPA